MLRCEQYEKIAAWKAVCLRVCKEKAARVFKEERFVNFSDVLIIIVIVLALILAGLYYLNKKSMRRMIQAQDFIDQNRTTVQIFVIDKKQEKPSPTNLPKVVYEQMPKASRMRKTNMVRAKVGPQIVTLLCDKPVYNVLPVKKTVKVELAGMYIIGMTGLNLEDKKKKTFSEKMSASVNRSMEKQSKNKK